MDSIYVLVVKWTLLVGDGNLKTPWLGLDSTPVSVLKHLANDGVWLNRHRSFPFFRHILRIRGMPDIDKNLSQISCVPSNSDIDILKKTHDARIQWQRKANSCRIRKKFILGGKNPRSTDEWKEIWIEQYFRLKKRNGEK